VLHRQLPDIYTVDNHASASLTSCAAVVQVEMAGGVVGDCSGVRVPGEGAQQQQQEEEVEMAWGVAAPSEDCVLSVSSGQDSSGLHQQRTTGNMADLTTATHCHQRPLQGPGATEDKKKKKRKERRTQQTSAVSDTDTVRGTGTDRGVGRGTSRGRDGPRELTNDVTVSGSAGGGGKWQSTPLHL